MKNSAGKKAYRNNGENFTGVVKMNKVSNLSI